MRTSCLLRDQGADADETAGLSLANLYILCASCSFRSSHHVDLERQERLGCTTVRKLRCFRCLAWLEVCRALLLHELSLLEARQLTRQDGLSDDLGARLLRLGQRGNTASRVIVAPVLLGPRHGPTKTVLTEVTARRRLFYVTRIAAERVAVFLVIRFSHEHSLNQRRRNKVRRKTNRIRSTRLRTRQLGNPIIALTGIVISLLLLVHESCGALGRKVDLWRPVGIILTMMLAVLIQLRQVPVMRYSIDFSVGLSESNGPRASRTIVGLLEADFAVGAQVESDAATAGRHHLTQVVIRARLILLTAYNVDRRKSASIVQRVAALAPRRSYSRLAGRLL